MNIDQQLFLEQIKEATKQGYLEAMLELNERKRKSKNRRDPDLISKSEAYRLKGRTRVDALLANPQYGLSTVKSGDSPTSPQYLSKKKLIELDKVRVP